MENQYINLSEDLANKIRLNMLANKSYNKLFVIGANRTGIKSLKNILSSFGFRFPADRHQIASIFNQIQLGNYLQLASYMANFDAFQDQPFSSGINYAVVDALFPNSKFILTVRNPEKWFESLVRYRKITFNAINKETIDMEALKNNHFQFKGFLKEHLAEDILEVSDYTYYENWSLFHDKDHYIKSYNQRNNEIIKYFRKRPDDLLILDITQEQTSWPLNHFLNIPTEFTFKIPHLNQSQ
jgi:hypothetical protein